MFISRNRYFVRASICIIVGCCVPHLANHPLVPPSEVNAAVQDVFVRLV
jgi:hypothetical protein